jgi:predicted metal-dependent hydrolase
MADTMIPRKMRIDFKEAPIHWARHSAFSTINNASSPLASAFEPYLNKIMARVRDKLPDSKAKVKANIDLFIAQEGHHYRVHNLYNKKLYAVYPDLRKFEQDLTAELKKQAETESLEYNMAWCCGFENLACYMAKFTFAKGLRYYEDADPRVSTMFLWHNAEEFEHRTACNDAFQALSGGYSLRIRGFLTSMKTIMTYHKNMMAHVFEVDRAKMSPEERADSVRFEKAYNRQFAAYVFPRMTQIFLPNYEPGRQRAPDILHKLLDDYEQLTLKPEPLTA